MNQRTFSLRGSLFSALVFLFASHFSVAEELITDSSQDWLRPASEEKGQWLDGYFVQAEEGRVFHRMESMFTYWNRSIGSGASYCAEADGTYPKVGRHAVAPHSLKSAARRWVSSESGKITVLVDAERLQKDQGNGQYVAIYHNETAIKSIELSDENLYETKILHMQVEKGDVLDFEVRARNNHEADWTALNARIYRGLQFYPEKAAYFDFEEANDKPFGWSEEKESIAFRLKDSSGRGNAAFLCQSPSEKFTPEFFWSGFRNQSLVLDGYRSQFFVPAEKIGKGATEFSISFWVSPSQYSTVKIPTLISTEGEDLVLINLSGRGKGQPWQFRVTPKEVSRYDDDLARTVLQAPDHSTKFLQWTQVTCVWKAGEIQKLYLNGQPVAESLNPARGALNIDKWFVGGDVRPKLEHRRFNGMLDDLRIVEVALNDYQVNSRYQRQLLGRNQGVLEGQGALLRERWTKLWHKSIEELVADPKFHTGAPKKELLADADTGRYIGRALSERLRGYVTAPESGYYRFWIAGTGRSDLLLSDSDSKFSKRSIANIRTSGRAIEGVQYWKRIPFDEYDSQASDSMYLEKGERYYIEVLNTYGKEHAGRIALAWQQPGKDREFIPAQYFSVYQPQAETNDADDDSLPDTWEEKYGLSAKDRGQIDPATEGEYGDFDNDGLINRLEYVLGLDPSNADSDGDGYSDGDECHSFGSDPSVKDRPRGELIETLALESYSSSDYPWAYIDGVLMHSHFRGALTWDFTAPSAGPYFYDITLKLQGYRSGQTDIPLSVMIDGKTIATEVVTFSGNHNRVWRVYGPPVSAGKHRLTLHIDNDRIKRALGIIAVEVRKPSGVDNDQDGIPDWYAAKLYQGSGIKLHQGWSHVSPFCLEGTVAQEGASVTVDAAPAQRFGLSAWYANVALQASAAKTVTVGFPDGRQQQNEIEWRPVNALVDQKFTVRLGDQLLIAAQADDGSPTAAKISVNGATQTSLEANATSIITFTEAGESTIEAKQLGGNGTGTITVQVVSLDLPADIALVSQRERKLNLPLLPAGVVLEGSKNLRVYSRTSPDSAEQIEVALLAAKGGDLGLVARLSEGGPILDLAVVPSITIANALVQNSSSAFANGAPKGYIRISAPFVVLNLPEGAYVELNIFRAGVMFDDGGATRKLYAEDFKGGVAFVDFLFPEQLQGGFCHHITVYDRHGVLLNPSY